MPKCETCGQDINVNYTDEYIKYFAAIPKGESRTWDDFFDHVGLARDMRTEFLVYCILNQVEIRNKTQ